MRQQISNLCGKNIIYNRIRLYIKNPMDLHVEKNQEDFRIFAQQRNFLLSRANHKNDIYIKQNYEVFV
jgi:hypothetical protein